MDTFIEIEALLELVSEEECFPGQPDSLSQLIKSSDPTEIGDDELESIAAAVKPTCKWRKQR